MHAGLDAERRNKMWSSSPKVKPQLLLTENFLMASILISFSCHFNANLLYCSIPYLNWKLHFCQANMKKNTNRCAFGSAALCHFVCQLAANI